MISRIKDFEVQGADGQRGPAEFEPRVDLSMGMKIIEIPKENEGIRGSGRAAHRAQIDEFEPRVDLNMGRKIIEIP